LQVEEQSTMRILSLFPVCLWLAIATSSAQSPRFVVDDDAFVAKVTAAALKLRESGKLLPQHSLQGQVHRKSHPLKLSPVSRRKLDPPELFDRLKESTLAVGTLYKCPDCGEWHFNSSAGFVAEQGGVICTCCHVVLGEDPETKDGYLIAADAEAHVFPVRSVLAADTESDTCLLRIDATGLKPLPLRPGVRTGERVYCLSHPGGYYFMFTQGMVARVNRRPNELPDAAGGTNSVLTRPILFLNVTAEFAPGSSGAPIVDEAGNVVGQVASIADAGQPDSGADHTSASPSVPVRFCTAAEEILHLGFPQSLHPIATFP
jgi:S1-C subfamily serine protease